jgi:hypothetical protein
MSQYDKLKQFTVVELDLTPHQISKLANGHVVQVKHSQLLHGHPIVMNKKMARKIHRAHAANRGARISLSQHELEHQGQGFFDTLKNIGAFFKDKVFSNEIYKKNIAPLIKPD